MSTWTDAELASLIPGPGPRSADALRLDGEADALAREVARVVKLAANGQITRADLAAYCGTSTTSERGGGGNENTDTGGNSTAEPTWGVPLSASDTILRDNFQKAASDYAANRLLDLGYKAEVLAELVCVCDKCGACLENKPRVLSFSASAILAQRLCIACDADECAVRPVFVRFILRDPREFLDGASSASALTPILHQLGPNEFVLPHLDDDGAGTGRVYIPLNRLGSRPLPLAFEPLRRCATPGCGSLHAIAPLALSIKCVRVHTSEGTYDASQVLSYTCGKCKAVCALQGTIAESLGGSMVPLSEASPSSFVPVAELDHHCRRDMETSSGISDQSAAQLLTPQRALTTTRQSGPSRKAIGKALLNHRLYAGVIALLHGYAYPCIICCSGDQRAHVDANLTMHRHKGDTGIPDAFEPAIGGGGVFLPQDGMNYMESMVSAATEASSSAASAASSPAEPSCVNWIAAAETGSGKRSGFSPGAMFTVVCPHRNALALSTFDGAESKRKQLVMAILCWGLGIHRLSLDAICQLVAFIRNQTRLDAGWLDGIVHALYPSVDSVRLELPPAAPAPASFGAASSFNVLTTSVAAAASPVAASTSTSLTALSGGGSSSISNMQPELTSPLLSSSPQPVDAVDNDDVDMLIETTDPSTSKSSSSSSLTTSSTSISAGGGGVSLGDAVDAARPSSSSATVKSISLSDLRDRGLPPNFWCYGVTPMVHELLHVLLCWVSVCACPFSPRKFSRRFTEVGVRAIALVQLPHATLRLCW